MKRVKVLKTLHEGKSIEPYEIDLSEATWKSNPGNIIGRMGMQLVDSIKKDNYQNQAGDPVDMANIQDMNVGMARAHLDSVPKSHLDAYMQQELAGKNRTGVINHINEIK